MRGHPQGHHPRGPMLAYVGTYTGAAGSGGNGQGIYLFGMEPSTGALTQLSLAAQIPSPSWMAIHPQGNFLYAVNAVSNFHGASGSVTAFSINRTDGALTLLNVVSSEGAGPAHLSVHPSGKYVLVANYDGGSIAVLPVLANGSLGAATDVHVDAGPPGPVQATNAPRGSFAISGHDAPHAHMIQSDPAGRFVFHSDLGQDRIYAWSIDPATGKLTPSSPPFVSLPPGDGPRHFAFHPNGKWFYCLQEEASTLEFFTYDGRSGSLTFQQMLSTLPHGFSGTDFSSDIRIAQDGKHLYTANRLHDSIAVFSVEKNGALARVGDAQTRGDYPVSFTMDPTGKFLFSCNQRSDAITAFRVDGGGRHLKFTGQYTPVGSPAMILFLS